MKKVVLVVIGSLLLSTAILCTGAGTAAAGKPTLKSLATAVAALQKKTATLSKQLKTANAGIASLRSQVAAANSTIAAQQATIAGLSSEVTAAKTTIATQEKLIMDLTNTVANHTQSLTSAASLLALAPYVSLDTTIMNGVKPPNIVFRGANVHVMSESSETDDSGTGNLIVGWNESPVTVQRGGSNNLVAGNYNNFSSHGGFICGNANTVNQLYASVSGGANNTASGESSSVSGGRYNTAAGQWASILGGGGTSQGTANTASASYSAIVGGAQNSIGANGWNAVICGGAENIANANYATVGGGWLVNLTLFDGWAAGGSSQTQQYQTH